MATAKIDFTEINGEILEVYTDYKQGSLWFDFVNFVMMNALSQ
jgi:hypothetical protein